MDNKKKQILKELEKQHGIVSAACNNIALARSTFYKWLNDDSEFKTAVDEIQEVAIDYVESKLFEKIEGVWLAGNGDTDEDREASSYKIPPSDTAIIFYLKTKAKKRGYVERTEHEVNGSMQINWSETKTYDTE